MRWDADGGAVFVGDALAVSTYPDALRADTSGDALAVSSGPDALRVDQRGDALALPTGSDAPALPARSVIRGDDPLTGYADATMLLGPGPAPRPAGGRAGEGGEGRGERRGPGPGEGDRRTADRRPGSEGRPVAGRQPAPRPVTGGAGRQAAPRPVIPGAGRATWEELIGLGASPQSPPPSGRRPPVRPPVSRYGGPPPRSRPGGPEPRWARAFPDGR